VNVVPAAEGTVAGQWAHAALYISFFLFHEIFFTESHIGLSANLQREEDRQLSSRRASPAALHREAIAESLLSVKPSPRGKGPSPRGTPLSAKALNPVVIS
jgi:hypothetical protein